MRLVLLLMALPLCGQGLDDWGRVRALAPGREVEMQLAGRTKLKGPLVSVDEQSITLAGKSIPKAEVRKVRVRSGSGRGLNAAKGAAIGAGAAAGLVLIALAANGGSDNAGAAVASSLSGGATWGAIIGACFAGYTTVYQAGP